MTEIRNPFKDKKTNWAELANKRVDNQNDKKPISPITNHQSESLVRVAKSFKVYKGKLTRDFDKRVNKLQVHFDDLDYDKNYVDSGKYIMFLMAIAEKYKLYDLYKEVNGEGDIEIKENELKEFFKNN